MKLAWYDGMLMLNLPALPHSLNRESSSLLLQSFHSKLKDYTITIGLYRPNAGQLPTPNDIGSLLSYVSYLFSARFSYSLRLLRIFCCLQWCHPILRLNPTNKPTSTTISAADICSLTNTSDFLSFHVNTVSLVA